MDWKDKAQIERNTKRYINKQEAVRVLLGGIGTGNISLDASGRMCDFELFNHPNKNLKLPYTFFSIWSKWEGEEPDTRILEAAPQGVCAKRWAPASELPGLPRFESSALVCRYPFVEVELSEEGLPLTIVAEAFTPFIPLDADNSGLPGFRMTYRVTNLSDKPAQVSVCGTLPNVVGFVAFDGFECLCQDGNPRNTLTRKKGLAGISFESNGLPCGHPTTGSMAISALGDNVTVKPQWQEGGWWDGAEEFWQDFRADGELCADVHSNTVGSRIGSTDSKRLVGSVAVKERIAPGESKEFAFYISWYFPNRYGWWPDGHLICKQKPKGLKILQNYYSTLWPNAWTVCEHFNENFDELAGLSCDFSDALYATTLDADVIESLVSAITVVRSPTCFRISDGSFFGWEGCFDQSGSCPGTCTHVWNYAQALAFLFPELERSARRTEFLVETDDTGKMAFRARKQLGDNKEWDMLPATDGQLGSILRVYREWKLSGDKEFLTQLWPKVVLAMEFSLKTWDSDGDYVLDDQQHNTYDIEFYGINSLTNSILYAALAACEEMANYLGEPQRAATWRKALASGSAKMDTQLWNGSYYEQGLSEEVLNKYRYQYGKGCLSDQLLGQQFAHIYGLGYILPEEHVRSAVKAIYDNNFKPSLQQHHSVQRGYAYQDEGGLLLCSWPKGERPKQPFVYSDEIWTGIEYQVATHLVYEGMAEQALDIIRAVRKRYDGNRRNPYNEVECGSHYARSMAAWGLLIAFSGYKFDLSVGDISFEPRVNADKFTCIYSNAAEWGVYVQYRDSSGGLHREIIPLYYKKSRNNK